METQALFSLLENYIERIPKSFYKKLAKELQPIIYTNRTTILKIGDYQKYFYYLSEGIATGSDKKGTVSLFCEENEIILFDRSFMDELPSTLEVTAEKGSVIYQIERNKFHQLGRKYFINSLLAQILLANTSYFNRLNTDMKSLSVKQRLQIIYKLHKNFYNTKLDILASFAGASIAQVCMHRKALLNNI